MPSSIDHIAQTYNIPATKIPELIERMGVQRLTQSSVKSITGRKIGKTRLTELEKELRRIDAAEISQAKESKKSFEIKSLADLKEALSEGKIRAGMKVEVRKLTTPGEPEIDSSQYKFQKAPKGKVYSTFGNGDDKGRVLSIDITDTPIINFTGMPPRDFKQVNYIKTDTTDIDIKFIPS